jgi:hypothetical protein
MAAQSSHRNTISHAFMHIRSAVTPIISSKKHGVYLNSCPARLQVLMNCGPAPERARGDVMAAVTTKTAKRALQIAATRAPSFGASPASEFACSDCGGWRRHYVRVGCQLISVREAFGDWYFSFHWKGGGAEYATVGPVSHALCTCVVEGLCLSNLRLHVVLFCVYDLGPRSCQLCDLIRAHLGKMF